MKKSWLSLTLTLPEGNQREIIAEYAMSLGSDALYETNDAIVVSYLHDGNERKTLEELKTFITSLGMTPDIKQEIVHDENWNANWQKYFFPVEISKRMMVIPEWENDDNHDILIRIRPAMAFGTGTHETTRMCLKWIDDFADTATSMLDMGTGSGILSLAALKCGAQNIDAIDIDEDIRENIHENFELNKLSSELLHLQISQTPTFQTSYDIIVANMIRANLFPVLPALFPRLNPNGKAIISGLLIEEKDEFEAFAHSNDWKIVQTQTLNEWIAFLCENSK